MTHYKCRFLGNPRNEGRFGVLNPGDEIHLTPKEYRCVADDPEFEFIEEVVQPLREVAAGNPSGPPETSPGTPGEVKEPGVDAVTTVKAPEGSEKKDEKAVSTYDQWSYQDLKDECSDRNEGREVNLLPTKGKKALLIEALLADDARIAAESSEEDDEGEGDDEDE